MKKKLLDKFVLASVVLMSDCCAVGSAPGLCGLS